MNWHVRAIDRDGKLIAQSELSERNDVSIGRDGLRDIVLQSASISRQHARVFVERGKVCIVDEKSANGVLVDGNRIEQATPIDARSRIELAEFRIVLEPVREAATAAAGMADSPASTLEIVIESGLESGRVYPVGMGMIDVGRSDDNDLVLPDPSLSRQHARIQRDAQRVLIEDLGSSNGTFVNGRRITKQVVLLGDSVRFGDLHCRLEGSGYKRRAPGVFRVERVQIFALLMTIVVVGAAIWLSIRPPPARPTNPRIAFAKMMEEADQRVRRAQRFFRERKYQDAKVELAAIRELDPGHSEFHKLYELVQSGPDDERQMALATAALTMSDRQGMERAIGRYRQMREGALDKTDLQKKVVEKLRQFSRDACTQNLVKDCAWAACELLSFGARDVADKSEIVRWIVQSETKLSRDPQFRRCPYVQLSHP